MSDEQHTPFVVVHWMDPASASGWSDDEEAGELTPAACETRGYLRVNDPTHIVVYASRSEDKGWGEGIAIPKGCITSMHEHEP